MRSTEDQPLSPQLEEQITLLKWADEKEMKKLVKDTYPSIVDVLIAGGIANS